MGILVDKIDKKTNRYVKDSATVVYANSKKDTMSMYTPTEEEKKCRTEFLIDFRLGWQTMHLPRPEFNDYSLYQRHVVDMMAFNSYQENDGAPLLEDRLGGWRSRAMRPVQRNKAYNDADDEQSDSAKIMGYLVDWAREQSTYQFQALHRVIMSLYSPISWGYTEYAKTYRNVKDAKVGGKWTYKQVVDENKSGFRHIPLATDQVFFSNFYERDCQEQDFIIVRRIISYDKFNAKYPEKLFPNSKFVEGGIIVTMDDANSGFYQMYDSHMRQYDVEEVIRWRKSTDSREVMCNGVLISEAYAANERNDHQYPVDCFYYLPINERCIAGKSLIFALGPESSLLNTQYQMINDANFLNLFPPTITSGSDKVGIDVIVPGMNLAFADKDVTINPLRVANDQTIRTAMDVMQQVEKSLAESSQDPIQQGQSPTGPASTAYEISRIEQNAATVLGLSMKFMANSHIIPYGKLLMSDILQYITVADADKIVADGGLIYKTFFVAEPGQAGKKNKISFDGNMPDSMTEEQKLDISWELLKAQGGAKSDVALWKVNPSLFRNNKYMYTIDADVLNPRSAELTRAFDLETYDRAINSPVANQESLYKTLLLGSNPKTARDPDKYVTEPPAQSGQPAPVEGSVAKPNTPILPDQKNPQAVAMK
jgi:hypothetical protein